jgi:allantoicase
MPVPNPPTMMPFTDLPDVAAERLGGVVLLANDEFFAPKENLLRAAKPVWREEEYTDRGKWMDGWETRRRRTPGHDWCIIRLGVPAIVRGVVVDTSYFRGNFPEACSLEGSASMDGVENQAPAGQPDLEWRELLPRTGLQGDTNNLFPIQDGGRVTHLRLNIYPDGGVARLRVHGEPLPNPRLRSAGSMDLAAVQNGGLVVGCSDMFFGNRHNLILPGYSTHMGDGWETRRRRGPGHDWIVVRLAARSSISRIEVDTDHFKGNAPESCSLECCDGDPSSDQGSNAQRWTPLLPRTPLQADARHNFDVTSPRPATHVRLAIYPDGGIARLRVFGTVTE